MSEALPARLARARAHMNVSMTAMADRVGLRDRKTWERYEKGETRPNSDVLSALFGMGFDATWLLTGEGEMLRSERERVSGTVIFPELPPPVSSGTPEDRLYDIAIRTTLRWYHAAGLEAAPDSAAAIILGAVRMIRDRVGNRDQTNAELAAEVAHILDAVRDMAAIIERKRE